MVFAYGKRDFMGFTPGGGVIVLLLILRLARGIRGGSIPFGRLLSLGGSQYSDEKGSIDFILSV